MKRVHLLLLCLVVIAVVPNRSYALDGSRRGFSVGLGVGVGAYGARSHQIAGASTHVRFGHGVSDRVTLHYDGKHCWASDDGVFRFLLTDGFGVSYFTQREAPSTYWVFSLGSSYGSYSGTGVDETTFWGTDLGLGFGYEFKPHWMIEFGAGGGLATDVDISLWNVYVRMAVLAY